MVDLLEKLDPYVRAPRDGIRLGAVQTILCSENFEFNKANDTIRVALYRSEEVQWEGDVRNGGEFHIVMHRLLHSAQVVERSKAKGHNLKVVWEIRNCDASAGDLTVPGVNSLSKKPAVGGAGSETIGDLSADDEETIAKPEDGEADRPAQKTASQSAEADVKTVPEPTETPANGIENMTISSDPDSDEDQDDNGLSKTTECMDGDEELKETTQPAGGRLARSVTWRDELEAVEIST
ncbi:hypothetical protein LZ31DRAFT_598688 [Colletotrichum somersetense]|nr:hypothetical protein LZ31DRAFT_598688 [Colletotrichum somersetense]